ncbi:MAG: hypothetical protein M3P50_07805 [Actinomycetota bacterium]|nr:hypothetical protein [Actinomycetota bacterium]
MAAPTLTRGRLRRLADLRPDHGRVLSVFLNLDPSEFATGAARATAITSVINEASHRVEEAEGLEHDEHQALRADVERVKEVLEGGDIAAGGVQGLAVYACGPADLLEIVSLAHPIESRAIVNHSPYVEPLVMQGESERVCILLANRRTARVLIGSATGFDDLGRIDDDVKNQHSQGGWSQARYERSVEEDKRDHLEHVARELFRYFKRRPFDRLLVGTPPELTSEMEGHLHPYLVEKLAGRLSIDVENSSTEEVREVAAPVIDEDQRAREREVLDRFAQEIGRGGRATAGLQPTLEALNEFKVESLLLEEGFRSSGLVEVQTGMLTADSGTVPVEDPQLEAQPDIVESAIEKAMEQSAEVRVIRRFADLGAHGGIGAILRY